jgi:hypothetical protein
VAEWGDDAVPCTIDSVEPLPPDIYKVMRGMDRKFRLETNEERLKLSEAEKHALVFIYSHYRANKL